MALHGARLHNALLDIAQHVLLSLMHPKVSFYHITLLVVSSKVEQVCWCWWHGSRLKALLLRRSEVHKACSAACWRLHARSPVPGGGRTNWDVQKPEMVNLKEYNLLERQPRLTLGPCCNTDRQKITC
jgi:hypothetical protein